ncbi:putative Zn-dependent protease [Rhizomicrobium palustre]|uniref:Putative Zn-dependent protease n=1 Tax=Rhizomicrobium palustre TaxID=189966 RepID=A0A846MZA0_9PROT|nr:tetratricopeptide repeat-containing sulfotransferase family protein [Rhizomicrobium palustre]NIK88579.1 putative Zn-dependent protease [Rhizomicrobium palustre]
MTDQRGSLATALAHLERLLATNPAMAEVQAQEILKSVPGEPRALLLMAAAQRAQGRFEDAIKTLDHHALGRLDPVLVEYDRAISHARAGHTKEAISLLQRVVKLMPDHPMAWRLLGDQYTLQGDKVGADGAYMHHVNAAVRDRRIMEAAKALFENRVPAAEQILRGHLKAFPTDIAAIRMLAELAARVEHFDEAEKLLARALNLAPSFEAARSNLVTVLHRQNKSVEALRELEILLQRHPTHAGYRNQHAAILARLGETDQAITIYRGVLKDVPNQPKIWMSFGHTLKTAGKRSEAETAYREAVELEPHLGEAWWSLANLKTFRFSYGDIALMQKEAERSDLSIEDRLHLDFALGKAFEDSAEYETSFKYYDRGNTLRRSMLDYDADQVSQHKDLLIQTLTQDFFAGQGAGGSDAPDPIFIVGLPRAGSTLIEQILASHSQVEGTMELPDIFSMVGRLKDAAGKPFYPEVLAALNLEERKALGEEFLARTRIHRKLGKPFFIDKMPNNFLQIGFIAQILPNAKIIDARRHPMACGFSCFKQHFARGQGFSYSLTDIGRYYADYVELMAHFDKVLPGRILRVQYEEVVEDLEGNVRRLLAYCGLPFEEACLRFYQNDRIVRTASSEQVRMPIFQDGLDQWRHFEKWLEPLRKAVGTAT